MSFDFQQFYQQQNPIKNSSNLRKSKGLQELIKQLDGKSEKGNQNNPGSEVDFSKFEQVQQSKSSYSKSFVSQFYNKPIAESQPKQAPKQSMQNRPQQYNQDNNTSRDIQQISYLHNLPIDQSFQFDRSLSYQLNQQNQQNSRFQRLKQLLSRSKQNNLDAFYRNIEQSQNQKTQDNLIFNNKKQFMQYTAKMKQNKKILEDKFKQEKKFKSNQFNSKNTKINLFGQQAVDMFKKKNQQNNVPIGNILPPEFSQDDDDEDFFNSNGQGINQNNQNHDQDFFNSNNNNNNNNRIGNQKISNKLQQFYQQGKQFFNINGQTSNKNPQSSSKPFLSSAKLSKNNPLQPIREQKATILDHSIQQKKFQQLIKDYNNMKNNYSSLMHQLKQTSQGQFKLMDEMQKIKFKCNKVTQQSLIQKQKQLQQQTQQLQRIQKQKQQKEKQKNKIKQIKQSQLTEIKNQIHEMKNNKNNNDVVYMKINQKIQQLEKIVRLALEQVIQQKQQKNNQFMPKVINYFDDNTNRTNKSNKHNQFQQNQDNDQQQQQVNLSRQSQNLYEINPNQHSDYIININQNKQSNTKLLKPLTNKNSKQNSNQNSQLNTLNRQKDNSLSGYISGYNMNNDKNMSKDQLNFIDQFSSPLQLDLSTEYHQNINNNNNDQQVQQSYQQEYPFNPPQHALQFLPLKLDPSPCKNLRNILTQKSSILYQSFQFLISIRYQMQQEQAYPIVGKIKVDNKCAIDLLDIFIIVYGSQGQNIQISPSKIFSQRLKFNSSLFFEVRLDRSSIQANGFNIQICYKTDSITKKKINFKALLPIVQLIKPQFCYQENFINCWQMFKNQIFIKPHQLNFKYIRTHDDLKLILPFIHITENDPNIFSYGMMFRYPKSKIMFLLKVTCYLNGKASIHLRTDKNGEQKLKEELLNVVNFLILG